MLSKPSPKPSPRASKLPKRIETPRSICRPSVNIMDKVEIVQLKPAVAETAIGQNSETIKSLQTETNISEEPINEIFHTISHTTIQKKLNAPKMSIVNSREPSPTKKRSLGKNHFIKIIFYNCYFSLPDRFFIFFIPLLLLLAGYMIMVAFEYDLDLISEAIEKMGLAYEKYVSQFSPPPIQTPPPPIKNAIWKFDFWILMRNLIKIGKNFVKNVFKLNL